MSLGEGHLTRIPAQTPWPGVALGTRYHGGTLMVGWRELVWSLIAGQGVEVGVTSNADINARGCAWIPIAMSHCHASMPVVEVGLCSTRASVWWILCVVYAC